MRSIATLLLLASWVFADAGAGPTQADAYVRQLGHHDFAIREKAEAALRKLGPIAREAVKAGLGSDDPEVRERTAILWRDLRWSVLENADDDFRMLRKSAAQRRNAPKAWDTFVKTHGAGTILCIRAIAEGEGMANALPVAWNAYFDQLDPKTIGAYVSGVRPREEGTKLLALLGEIDSARLRGKTPERLLETLNMLWEHGLALRVGIQILRKRPDSPARTHVYAAIRAGGFLDRVWKAAEKGTVDAAALCLLAGLAREFQCPDRLRPFLHHPLPADMDDRKLGIIAEDLEHAGMLADVCALLKNAKKPVLRYRRCQALGNSGHQAQAEEEWRELMLDLEDKGGIYSLADLMAKHKNARAEDVWKRLLGDGVSKCVYASNACFRLASYCEKRKEYAKAADLKQQGIDRMSGMMMITGAGKTLSGETAIAYVRGEIQKLRAKAAATTE